MRKRFCDRIQNTFVEICLAAPDYEFNLFAAVNTYVANNSRKTPEQLIHRNHSNLHDRVLQVIQNSALEGHGVSKLSPQDLFWKALSEFMKCLLQHRFCEDQLAHQIQHTIDSLCIHTQQVVRCARYIG